MNLKKNLLILLFSAALPSFAQDHLATIDVKTSTVCDMCEKTIETELIYEKGVRHVDVYLEEAIVQVQYDDRKTDPVAIRTALSKLGYDADGVKADEKAWQKLPDCCKKEGCGKSVKP